MSLRYASWRKTALILPMSMELNGCYLDVIESTGNKNAATYGGQKKPF